MRLGISLEPTSRVNVETRMTSGTLKLRLKHPIRILHLEKNPDHSNLVKLKLKAEGVPCVLRRIENRADFIAALEATLDTFDVSLRVARLNRAGNGWRADSLFGACRSGECAFMGRPDTWRQADLRSE